MLSANWFCAKNKLAASNQRSNRPKSLAWNRIFMRKSGLTFWIMSIKRLFGWTFEVNAAVYFLVWINNAMISNRIQRQQRFFCRQTHQFEILIWRSVEKIRSEVRSWWISAGVRSSQRIVTFFDVTDGQQSGNDLLFYELWLEFEIETEVRVELRNEFQVAISMPMQMTTTMNAELITI